MSDEEKKDLKDDTQVNYDIANNMQKTLPKKLQVVKSTGVWGEREGNKYTFTDSKKIKLDDSVYRGLTYKKVEVKVDSDGKKIVVLQLAGQSQKLEFPKDELYKNFGVKIKTRGKDRKQRGVSCNDEEHKVMKDILLPLLRDEHYFRILKSNDINRIKKALDNIC